MVSRPLTFLREAFRDRGVGALSATSVGAVRAVCRRLDRLRPLVVVEYGPGTGVFTRHLLEHLHPDSTIVAIELNPEFARQLRAWSLARRSRRPRLIVERGSCEHVREILERHRMPHADAVLSGIPFSFLDADARERIVASTHAALVAQGRFLVYQYSFLMRRTLRHWFAEVRSSYLLLNFPPLCMMDARK